MDKVITGFKVMISGVTILLMRFISFGAFKTKHIFFTADLPDIRYRKKGSVYLGYVKFRSGCKIFADGGKVVIADGCFINNNCSFNIKGILEVGDDVLFGEGVKIYDHNHVIKDGYYVSKDEFIISNVKIGSNCWIGSNAIILKGVTLANNVIIGAGAVVARSIYEPGVYVSNNGGVKKIK